MMHSRRRVERLTSSRVPPELTDMMIDYLHDDTDAVQNCSLVCRAWLPACRFHLFRSLTCERAPLEARVQLLQSSPHIGPYVKELQVTLRSTADVPLLSYLARRLGHVECLSLTWTVAIPSLPPSLSSMGPVKQLTLGGNMTESPRVLAETLWIFPGVKDMDFGLECLPTRSMDVPSLVAAAEALTRASLERIAIPFYALVPCLYCARNQPNAFRAIKELDFRPFDYQSWPVLPPIVLACSKTLEVLALNASINGYPPHPPLVDLRLWSSLLRRCPKLRHFCFYINEDHTEFYAVFFSALLQPTVSSILLVIDLYFGEIDGLQEGLPQLGSVLGDEKCFPALKHLTVKLRGDVNDENWLEFERLKSECFVKVRARGIKFDLIFEPGESCCHSSSAPDAE